MKRFAFPLTLAAGLAGIAMTGVAASPALAAELALKAPPMAAPASPWDVAITAALMTDYNWRGVTQSNHKPSAAAGFESDYNVSKDVQLYAGISGESISFPNQAAAEIDFYGGIRPTFGKLALDFGGWYYYYPGGQCFDSTVPGCRATITPSGNTASADVSFYEVYAKATYAVNDNFSFGGNVWYSPSVANSGVDGLYYAGNVTFTAPSGMLPHGIGTYASGDIGYWSFGTGLPSYTNWDLGIGFTYRVFTLDLRYYDSDLSKTNCNNFTGDFTANAAGESNWCSAAFIAKLSAAINLSSVK